MAAKKRSNMSFSLEQGFKSQGKQDSQEDVCSFIKVTEKQQEYLK